MYIPLIYNLVFNETDCITNFSFLKLYFLFFRYEGNERSFQQANQSQFIQSENIMKIWILQFEK